MFLPLLLACETEEPPEQPPCTLLDDGTWSASGSAFGIGGDTVTSTLTMDADACTFALDAWSAGLTDVPSGGRLSGAEVTLAGDNADWSSCTGKATGTTHMTGNCPDHGGDFSLSH